MGMPGMQAAAADPYAAMANQAGGVAADPYAQQFMQQGMDPQQVE
jgi:hypothetical protein